MPMTSQHVLRRRVIQSQIRGGEVSTATEIRSLEDCEYGDRYELVLIQHTHLAADGGEPARDKCAADRIGTYEARSVAIMAAQAIEAAIARTISRGQRPPAWRDPLDGEAAS